MFSDKQLTLLTEGQVWGNDRENQLEVLKRYGTKSAISDLVVLTGGYCEDTCTYMAPDDDTLKGRTGWVYTQSSDGYVDVRGVYNDGNSYNFNRCTLWCDSPSFAIIFCFLSNLPEQSEGV